MKIFGAIFLCGILMACGHKSVEKQLIEDGSEKAIPVKIEIKKTSSPYILTPYNIDCEEFDEWVNDIMSLHIIENKDSIELIVNAIKELEESSSNYPIDVRTKIFIFYQNEQIDTICMDKSRILINGELYLNNKKIIDIIEGL